MATFASLQRQHDNMTPYDDYRCPDCDYGHCEEHRLIEYIRLEKRGQHIARKDCPRSGIKKGDTYKYFYRVGVRIDHMNGDEKTPIKEYVKVRTGVFK